MGKQSFPLYASSQTTQVCDLVGNSNVKSTVADTKVTFSGQISQSVPPKRHVMFGLPYGSGPVSQTQSVQFSSASQIPPHVGISTVGSVVPPVSVSFAGESGPSPSVGVSCPAVGQQASFANVAANSSGSDPMQHGVSQIVGQYQQAPSSAQLAARQVMPRELPTFSGDPQDWPLFSSSFYNTTTACGFTDAENLARLQRCLKGHALDSVRSRLLIPQSVPHVMETLRTLYGRPEVLIHTLLRRLRSVPPPRTENLQSVIAFGMSVRNLVDHMFVAQMLDHLRNPMLLHELVEKLPSTMKMQWSWYKRSQKDVNLATFGEFMSELMTTGSDVTLPTDESAHQPRPRQNGG